MKNRWMYMIFGRRMSLLYAVMALVLLAARGCGVIPSPAIGTKVAGCFLPEAD